MGKVVLVAIIVCLTALGGKAQNAAAMHKILTTPKDSLPYRLNPVLPSFNIKLTDSATIFNTKDIPEGQPTVLMLFSPDCRHCQDIIQMLLNKMDSLSDVRFCMFSNTHNVTDIRNFSDNYHLQNYKNIIAVGQDYEFFFLTHYGTRYVPDFAVYDKHNKLIKLYESSVTVTELYNATR